MVSGSSPWKKRLDLNEMQKKKIAGWSFIICSYAQTRPSLITSYVLSLPKPQITLIKGSQRKRGASIKPYHRAPSHIVQALWAQRPWRLFWLPCWWQSCVPSKVRSFGGWESQMERMKIPEEKLEITQGTRRFDSFYCSWWGLGSAVFSLVSAASRDIWCGWVLTSGWVLPRYP